jgi:hypothetical protein
LNSPSIGGDGGRGFSQPQVNFGNLEMAVSPATLADVAGAPSGQPPADGPDVHAEVLGTLPPGADNVGRRLPVCRDAFRSAPQTDSGQIENAPMAPHAVRTTLRQKLSQPRWRDLQPTACRSKWDKHTLQPGLQMVVVWVIL